MTVPAMDWTATDIDGGTAVITLVDADPASDFPGDFVLAIDATEVVVSRGDIVALWEKMRNIFDVRLIVFPTPPA